MSPTENFFKNTLVNKVAKFSNIARSVISCLVVGIFMMLKNSIVTKFCYFPLGAQVIMSNCTPCIYYNMTILVISRKIPRAEKRQHEHRVTLITRPRAQ